MNGGGSARERFPRVETDKQSNAIGGKRNEEGGSSSLKERL